MAAIPPIKKLLVDDYPSEASWIGGLLVLLNQFMLSVVEALTFGLTIAQNTTSDIKTLRLSAVPSVSSPASVKWSKKSRPIAVLVGNVQPVGSAAAASDAVAVQFQMAPSGEALQITGLVGLTPSGSAQYDLTLICIAG